MRARRAFGRTGATPTRFLRRNAPDDHVRPAGLPTPYVAFEAHLIAEPEAGETTTSMEQVPRRIAGEFMLPEEATMREPAVAEAILKEQNPRCSRVLGSRAEYIAY